MSDEFSIQKTQQKNNINIELFKPFIFNCSLFTFGILLYSLYTQIIIPIFEH